MFSIVLNKQKSVPQPSCSEILKALFGGSLSIGLLLLLSQWSGHLWIMAPFGASCVLLYAAAQSPLAQPRNVILGHFITACIGLIFLKLLGVHVWSIALSVGCAIAMMQWLGCVHPPAGANPLVILLTANTIHYDGYFLIFPVLSGAVALVLIAKCVNNFKARQK
ncbi:HPP family protein [Acinetobacter sp. MD2(2019)]|uniref:HPP family protein n=1 Tax=Acinetobacter sp. MD2(2019) TaxID=2605273 RepID=UPI002D1EDB46|nr:HPP family protein [Acinetobacter sp. MD2(2019)]MEB3755074.1 HPP family protein [Acinetobacter sp. MD2(2019)]